MSTPSQAGGGQLLTAACTFHEEAKVVQSESTRAIPVAGGTVGSGETVGQPTDLVVGCGHLLSVSAGGEGGGAGRSCEAAPGPDGLAPEGPPRRKAPSSACPSAPPTPESLAARPQPRSGATHSPCFHSQSRRRPSRARCMLGIRPVGALQSDERPRRLPGGSGSQVQAQSPGLDVGVATDRWAAGWRLAHDGGGRRRTRTVTSVKAAGVQVAGCSSGSRWRARYSGS